MNYEIQSKNEFSTGALLVVNIPEDELDHSALYTIQTNTPAFIIPFHHRAIEGQIEFTYHIGTHSKLQQLSGSLSPKEYAEMWLGTLNPLLDCGDWFMNPYSFVLDAEHLYYNENIKTVNYIYIPSIRESSDYNALREMAVELTKLFTANDPVMENKVLRSIMRDFNPKELLTLLKPYASTSLPHPMSTLRPLPTPPLRPIPTRTPQYIPPATSQPHYATTAASQPYTPATPESYPPLRSYSPTPQPYPSLRSYSPTAPQPYCADASTPQPYTPAPPESYPSRPPQPYPAQQPQTTAAANPYPAPCSSTPYQPSENDAQDPHMDIIIDLPSKRKAEKKQKDKFKEEYKLLGIKDKPRKDPPEPPRKKEKRTRGFFKRNKPAQQEIITGVGFAFRTDSNPESTATTIYTPLNDSVDAY